jgi:hypothetical protein
MKKSIVCRPFFMALVSVFVSGLSMPQDVIVINCKKKDRSEQTGLFVNYKYLISVCLNNQQHL